MTVRPFKVVVNFGPPDEAQCILDLYEDFGGVLPACSDLVVLPDGGIAKVEQRIFSRAHRVQVTCTLRCSPAPKEDVWWKVPAEAGQ